MAPPTRSPLRPPPPPLPSRSLIGMEKATPPYTTSSQWQRLSPAADADKPLPQRPQPSRRSSSVYSDDSGYTKIIDLYTNWKVDDDHVTTSAFTYQDTLTSLLARRLTESSSPISPLTIPHYPTNGVSVPPLQLTSGDFSATSRVHLKTAPSFFAFSRSLQAKKSDMTPPLSSPGSPHYGVTPHETFWRQSQRSSPKVQTVAFENEREQVACDSSPHITKVSNPDLVPPPLDLGGSSRSLDQQSLTLLKVERKPDLVLSEQGSSSKFSSISSSDNSCVIYTGVREAVWAIIRNKMGKKDSDRRAEEGVQSLASVNNQMSNSESSWQPERNFSWVDSRRSSFQQGVTSARRSLSLTKPPSPGRQVPQLPRRRQKQLAVPLTPYQKCGTTIWHNSQSQKRRKACADRTLQKSPTPSAGIQHFATQNHREIPTRRSNEMLMAFQSGRSQILSVLDETKLRIGRTSLEKSRGSGKKSSKLIQADVEKAARKGIFRSNSEKRRERLKKSIALVGPVDPYAVEHIAGTDSEKARDILKSTIKAIGLIEGEPIKQVESWL